MTPRRTYLPGINTLSCSKACGDIEPVLENISLFYVARNHSSVTRLNKIVYRCQMYNTTES